MCILRERKSFAEWNGVSVFNMPLTSSMSNDSNRISDIPIKFLQQNNHYQLQQQQRLEDIALDNIKFIDENENIECLNATDCCEEDAATNEK